MSLSIGGRLIGENHPPFIIAEMSGNHNQSLNKALEMVQCAKNCGADAIKLQTYTADTITLNVRNKEFVVNDSESPWNGQNIHALYKSAYTPWEWHKPIMNKAEEIGLLCFSSPFDETAVDFLEELHVPAYKIASFENNHLPLIAKAASTNKPLIISSGMASIGEIEAAVSTAKANGCKDIIILKCTSTYPADPKNTNIKTIENMRRVFDLEVGISDHTLGIGVSIASVALGATVIEKHFTLNREEGGVDSQFSLEPDELAALVDEAKRAWEALGNIQYGSTKAEEESRRHRRSIYASANIKKDEILTANNTKIVRPGYGLAPKYYELIIGSRATKDIDYGEAIKWEHLMNKMEEEK